MASDKVVAFSVVLLSLLTRGDCDGFSSTECPGPYGSRYCGSPTNYCCPSISYSSKYNSAIFYTCCGYYTWKSYQGDTTYGYCSNDYAWLYCRPPSSYCCRSHTYTYNSWHKACCTSSPTRCESDRFLPQTCGGINYYCCPYLSLYTPEYGTSVYHTCCNAREFESFSKASSVSVCKNTFGVVYCGNLGCCSSAIFSTGEYHVGCCGSSVSASVTLNAGAIVGIVAGCVVGVVLLSVCTALICRGKRHRTVPKQPTHVMSNTQFQQGTNQPAPGGVVNPAVSAQQAPTAGPAQSGYLQPMGQQPVTLGPTWQFAGGYPPYPQTAPGPGGQPWAGPAVASDDDDDTALPNQPPSYNAATNQDPSR